MSEALPFAKINLRLLQRFLCALAVRDVLDRTKHFIWSPRCVSFYRTQSVDSPHFATRANDAMFDIGARFAMKGLLRCPEDKLSIFGVDHFATNRHVYGAFLRTQPINSVQFVGPDHAILDEVPIIVTDLGYSLGFFESGFALL